MKKIFLISLGCAKNLVDSEHILGMLTERHFSIVPQLDEAEVAIVNTCGFIQSAVEEAVETILEVSAKKKEGKLERVLVTGCFVQRYGYRLRDEIPEVDGWFGTGEWHRIVEMLEKEPLGAAPFHIKRPTHRADETTPRLQTTPPHSAYLKIAEGCSHQCTYCTIPRLRGPFRSRTMESILLQVRRMVENGVKEINLVAQDTTMYGRDLVSHVTLEDLLERLVRIQDLKWIRIMYAHPYRISNRLLELMDSEQAICPYLDIPLQHVNGDILRAMGRGENREEPWDLVERIRSRSCDICLRTTLMVGFPGETEKIFQELYQFVRKAAFDRLGVFIFSREKGTRASRLRKRVSRKKAEMRRDAIMELQAEISQRKHQEMVGKIVPVLMDGYSPETDMLLTGRTATMAPDVDGQVLIYKGRGVIGDICQVRITEGHPYDLEGEIIE